MFKEQKKKSGFLSGVIELAGLLLIVFVIRTIGFGLYQVPTGSMETTMLVGERFFADKFTYLFIRKPKQGDVIAFNDATYTYSENTIRRWFEWYVYGPSNITKRVIGLPGDKVRGTIQNGIPSIYVNDKKLQESYLNKYPLLRVYKEDPSVLLVKIDQELRGAFGWIDPRSLAGLRERKLLMHTMLRSYDPKIAYYKQPFYRIKQNRVFKTADGHMDLWRSGMPSRATSQRIERDNSYWDGSDEFYVELDDDEYWVMGDNRLGSKDCRSFGPIKEHLIHGRIIFCIWSIDSYESWFIFDLLKNPIDFWRRVRWSRCFQIIY